MRYLLLINSVPIPDPDIKWEGTIELPPEEEMRTTDKPGCRFYPRCPEHMPRCLDELPPLYRVDGANHLASCYLYEEMPVAEFG